MRDASIASTSILQQVFQSYPAVMKHEAMASVQAGPHSAVLVLVNRVQQGSAGRDMMQISRQTCLSLLKCSG